MSKKILKRSLALGALMAFVITGSAMAADEISGHLESGGKYEGLKIANGNSIYGSDLTFKSDVTMSGYDGNYLATLWVKGSPEAKFSGETFCVDANYKKLESEPTKESYAMAVSGGSKVIVDAQDADISFVGNDLGADGWGFGLYVASSSDVEFTNGVKDVDVSAVSKGDSFTVQGLTVRGNDTKLNFNNTGDVVISVESSSVTGVDMIMTQGDNTDAPSLVFNNDGDVTIKTKIIPNDEQGKANSIGIQADNDASLRVTNKVNTFKIEQTGVGVDADGTGYSSGSKGIDLDETSNVEIESQNFIIDSIAGSVTGVTTEMIGIDVNDGSTFAVGKDTISKITVENGSGDVYGIRSESYETVKFLGITTINSTATGKAYGVYGEASTTVDIKGDVEVNAKGHSAYGVEAYGGAVVELGNDNANVKFNITSTGANKDAEAQAISAEGSSRVTVKANELNITTTAKSNVVGSLQARGGSTISVTANKATIDGMMFVGSNSSLDISGIEELTLNGLVSDNKVPAILVDGTLKVNKEGTLAIQDAKAGNTYNVVAGNVKEAELWAKENIAYDRTEMFATVEMGKMQGDSSTNDSSTEVDVYKVVYKAADVLTPEEQQAAAKEYVSAVTGEAELAVPGLVGSAAGQGSTMEETTPGAKTLLSEVASNSDMPKETKAAVINSAAQLAEAGGNAGTAVSVASNVSNVTTGRMSFGAGNAKGGKGVGLFEEGSGAAVWAQYMHGKDDATDMPMDGGATSYESEYDGIVLGVDFKKVGKFQSGIAFNYGEGDSTGFTSAAKTKSDYDFWGIGYYGNIRNDDTNFIFDVNYAKSDSDVTQNNIGATGDIEASPETTTWSAGVKVEKLYQNNNVQIVPYTGLRYMSIDTDEYKSTLAGETLFNYAPERQDIWLLPLGVTIKQEVVNNNGWVVTPKVDLSYIWAFGDTDSNMSVSIPGIAASNDTLGFTVMDDGSFLGLVGVEAKLDDWTFGVSYSYQKGDYAESKKWFVDAKYSF